MVLLCDNAVFGNMSPDLSNDHDVELTPGIKEVSESGPFNNHYRYKKWHYAAMQMYRWMTVFWESPFSLLLIFIATLYKTNFAADPESHGWAVVNQLT